MKKIIACLMCAIMLMCVLPTVALAEEVVEPVEKEPPVVETETWQTTADQIVAYITEHVEELSVIISLIVMVFYEVRKHGVLNKSIGTLNNNAVTVAENSNNAIQKALDGMGNVAEVVTAYKAEIEALLEAFRASTEDKHKLEQTLAEVHASLKTAKLANIELANELAELLVLANIPNAKKEELYSRHLAAVGAIADAEKTEVVTDVNGQETK